MQEERKKILEMVAEATISVDEAEELLASIESNKTTGPPREQPLDEREEIEDAIPDLGRLRSDLRRLGRELRRAGRQGKFQLDLDLGELEHNIARAVAIPRRPARVRRHHHRRDHEAIGENPSFERLVEMGALGIKPAYIKELKDAGLSDLTWDEVMGLRSLGIKPEYVRDVRDLLGEDVSADEIMQLGGLGVSSSYIEELKDVGLDRLSVDQVTELAALGIRADYVREMRDAGLGPFSETGESEDTAEKTDDEQSAGAGSGP
jgi:hypothetical protein